MCWKIWGYSIVERNSPAVSSAEVQQQHSAIYVVFRDMPPAESARSGGVAVATAAAQTPTVRRAPIHRLLPGHQHHTLLSYCENQSVNKEHNYMSFDHHQGYYVFFFFFLILLSLSRRTLAWKYIQRRGDYDKVVYFFKAVQ